MNKLSFAAAISVALSSVFAAPVAAQEAQVAVSYADLDLTTAAGVQTLGQRVEAGVKVVCDRPDMRELKSMLAWEQCKEAAMTSANEQLARLGATVTIAD